MNIRIVSTGETISVKTTTLRQRREPIPIWYNPRAQGVMDERVVSAEPHHGLPSTGEALVLTLMTALSAFLGLRLLKPK